MRLVLSLVLMAGTALPGMAQDSTDVLRGVLDRMPEMLLTNPDPMQIFFVDMQAWRGLSDGEPTVPSMMRLTIARNIAPLEVLNYGGLDGWDEKAGIGLDDISYFAGFGQPPFMIGYWGFDSADKAAELIDNLKQRDFSDVEGPVQGVIGNGEPNLTSLQDRDPANPWRGSLGKSFFAFALDDVVIQAPAPEAMAAMSQIEPSAAANVILATALDGLSGTISVDHGQIIQAMVISPAFGLESADPASLLGATSIEEAKAALEAAVDASKEGVPPYFGGIVADVEFESKPALAVSLVYADCETADSAMAILAARWADNMNATAEAYTHSVANDGDLCAGVISFVAEGASEQGNPLLHETFNRFMSREFNLLQIGLQS